MTAAQRNARRIWGTVVGKATAFRDYLYPDEWSRYRRRPASYYGGGLRFTPDPGQRLPDGSTS